MRFVWNNVTITAIEPSVSDLMQSAAEDAEFETIENRDEDDETKLID